MNRRLTLLALVAILVATAAVPAIGQEKLVTPTIDGKTSVRALAKARLALLTARSAKSESRRAARTAQAALNAANEAKELAKGSQGPPGPMGPHGAGAAPVQSGVAVPAVSTESEAYVPLSGGPVVTVDVSSSGLIEVWAQVTFEGEGAVALFEDGSLMPGQSEFCAPEEEGRALLAAVAGEGSISVSTPSTIGIGFFGGPFFFCGTLGPPSPVLFQTSPGTHTYELRYKYCGCEEEEEAVFSQRRLFVAPRP